VIEGRSLQTRAESELRQENRLGCQKKKRKSLGYLIKADNGYLTGVAIAIIRRLRRQPH
jgi:hypothetical protein